VANCIYCGDSVALFSKKHIACEDAKYDCTTQEEFRAARATAMGVETANTPERNRMLNAARSPADTSGIEKAIMWGVFKALWLYTLVAVIVGLFIGLIRILFS
jgi:hypothetical protein